MNTLTLHKPRLVYITALSLLLGGALFSGASHAATPLSDTALSQETETNHSELDVPDVLDCDKDMRKAECNRLQYENYANQTDRSYNEFLKNETNNPLRNRIIKQPLLTQPLEKSSPTPEQRPNLPDLINRPQLPALPPER
ncbi:hypothetical protein ACF3NA_00400 [Alkanindiges sp. WGS2144]|uniref:hypothetical protein n=1 Tax=Alkanindiges sp. WGS2144 TaxID=3366808 RepID=UPI0037507B6E